jgi:hypothetical protein
MTDVKHPRVQVIDKDSVLLKFEYPIDGQDAGFEIKITRQLVKSILERMDSV